MSELTWWQRRVVVVVVHQPHDAVMIGEESSGSTKFHRCRQQLQSALYWQVSPSTALWHCVGSARYTFVATFQPQTIRIGAGNIRGGFPTGLTNTKKAPRKYKFYIWANTAEEGSRGNTSRNWDLVRDKA